MQARLAVNAAPYFKTKMEVKNMNLATTIKLATKGFMPGDIKKISESGIDAETVIALAENGYSAKDVDELITFASTQTEETQPTDNPGSSDASTEQDDNKGDDAGDDYKQQLEDAQKHNKELEEQLKKIQQLNSQKDLGSGKSTVPGEDEFKEALRNLY